MPSIEDQIALEKRMVAYGVNRYRNSVKNAEENGRGADNQYAQKLMQEFIEPVSNAIATYCTTSRPGVKAKFKTLLQQVDPDKAAFFGLKALFNHFTYESTLTKLAANIGMMIEDELKFGKFSEQEGDYYDAIIRDFKRKGTKSYRHMHRVLTFKANEKEVQWNSWTQEERVSVGVKVIDCILTATDLIEKKTRKVRKGYDVTISPTAAALEWMKNFHEYAELMNPDRMPCLIQPDEWTELSQGGYYTPQLRKRTPLVKTRSREHEKMFDGDIGNITRAVNALQNVPWRLNEQVYEVLKQAWDQSLSIGLPQSEPYEIPDCPIPPEVKKKDMTESQKDLFENWKSEASVIHTMEKERVSKCFQVIRVLRLAREYSAFDQFWYVYQCDFRGRIYATVSGFSPQGPDFAKALLQFSEGKALGERGVYWLKVHGANTYGVDKEPYEVRVKWVEDNEQQILRVADDPLSHREFWADADKPWQFLAFCFEYKRYKKEGIGMLSYLPIGLDGSCNGLQNFSAMLHDEIGGRATNLVPSDSPSDIYTEVAKVCTEKLRRSPESAAKLWVRYCDTQGGTLPRAVAKKPVMTLPYGSTQQSCRESIYRFIVEEAQDYFPRDQWFQLSVFLTPILWEAIGDVVVAARKAMDWLQDCAGIISKGNNPIVWWTPVGFPVYQERKKIASRQVKTELAGMFQIRVGSYQPTMDVIKNKLGAAPNFVHSMDACHLMLTLDKALDRGLRSFACIHDDYGTHAADTDDLHAVIREAFLELYTENEPLLEFKIINEDTYGLQLPELPTRGNLDLTQILGSAYFFG